MIKGVTKKQIREYQELVRNMSREQMRLFYSLVLGKLENKKESK